MKEYYYCDVCYEEVELEDYENNKCSFCGSDELYIKEHGLSYYEDIESRIDGSRCY